MRVFFYRFSAARSKWNLIKHFALIVSLIRKKFPHKVELFQQFCSKFRNKLFYWPQLILSVKNSWHFCRLLLFKQVRKASASQTDVVIIFTFQFAVRDKRARKRNVCAQKQCFRVLRSHLQSILMMLYQLEQLESEPEKTKI